MVSQIDKFKDLILEVLKKHDVKKASLFGSTVKEERTEDSDVDILVEFQGTKSLLDLARLKIELEKVLKCRVDVLTYNSLHPLLEEQILSEQVEIL